MDKNTTTQPLFADDDYIKKDKPASNVKMYVIFGICIVLSLLIGITIGYFAFGRKTKSYEVVIYGDMVSEITDPMDTYALIDVRNQTEWNEVRIESAILIPIYELEEKIGNYVQNKSFPIKVFCKSGGRASKAKEKLLINGYKNVVNLGGIERAIKLIKDAVVIRN